MKTNKYLYRVSLMMGFVTLFSLSSCGEDNDLSPMLRRDYFEL